MTNYFQRGFQHSYFYLEIFSNFEYIENGEMILIKIYINEDINFNHKLISETKKKSLETMGYKTIDTLFFELLIPMGIWQQAIQEVDKWCLSLIRNNC